MINPQDFYFSIRKIEDGFLEIVICPKEYWEEKRCLSDNYFDFESLLPEYFEAEDCENVWIIEDKNIDEVKTDLEKIGFVFNKDICDFLIELAEGE